MEEKKENKGKKSVIIAIVLLLSVVFISAGISMAIFTYFGSGNTNNVIQTGKLVFSYSDATGGGNGINITDAAPISDAAGKVLSGTAQYFDFSVNASTTSTNLAYEIVVNKQPNSTLEEEWVKVYLTELSGNTEIATPITGGATVPTYDQLSTTTNALLTGKTVYHGTVNAGEIAYGKSFRLRMWVKDPQQENFDYDSLVDKTFKLKVNVAAVGSN